MNVSVAESVRQKAISSETFYGALALLLVLMVFVAFSPTFYLRSAFNGRPVPALAAIHGTLATIWICLVAVQAFLIRAHQRRLHRYLGWFNAALAIGIVALTPVVMLRFIPRTLAAQFGPAEQVEVAIAQIFISDVIALPVFLGMFIAAMRNRHRPTSHQRWIMYASLMLATPAPGRAGFIIGIGFGGLLVMPLLAIVCAIYDRRTLGRVYPSTKLCLAVTIGHAVLPLVLAAFSPVVRLVLSLG